MSFPDLCIAPCEAGDLAPDEPLCAPAEYRVRVWRNWRFHTYLVRRVKTVFVEMYDRKFYAAQNVKPESPTLFIELPVPENPVRSFQTGLGRRFYDWRWRRLLYFDEDLNVTTSRTNWKFCLEFAGRWRKVWGRNGSEERALFALTHPIGRSFYWHTLSNGKLSRLIIQKILDSNSDCYFALRCVQMTEQQRSEFFFPVLRGVRSECDHLLRLILQTDYPPDFPHTWAWSVPLAMKEHLNQWSSYHAKLAFCNRWGGITASERALTQRQMRLLEIVVHHFGLHWENLYQKHTAAYFDREGCFICASPPLTTQHERLEARLQLREWLRDKVSPKEMSFLLGDS